ncbi:hypothetical protein E2P81_ATG09052 [Venturia nashicola]|nr:hypothetical protein E2P81_ATG09052 [Venturia nashicola]
MEDSLLPLPSRSPVASVHLDSPSGSSVASSKWILHLGPPTGSSFWILLLDPLLPLLNGSSIWVLQLDPPSGFSFWILCCLFHMDPPSASSVASSISIPLIRLLFRTNSLSFPHYERSMLVSDACNQDSCSCPGLDDSQARTTPRLGRLTGLDDSQAWTTPRLGRLPGLDDSQAWTTPRLGRLPGLNPVPRAHHSSFRFLC